MRINLPLLLIALLVAVGFYALYDRVEFYKKSENGPWSEAAQHNPFLAAQRYLEEQNIAVRSDAELSPRDDLTTHGTLILMHSTAVRNEFLAEKILNWVEHGGHLIVEPSHGADDDFLLAKYHITKKWASEEDDDDDSSEDDSLEDDSSDGNELETEQSKTAAQPAPAPLPEKKVTDDDAPEEKKISQRLREYNEKINKRKSLTESKESTKTQCSAPDFTDLTDIQLPGSAHIIQAKFSNYSVLKQPYFEELDHEPAKDVPKPAFFIRNKSGVHLAQFAVGAGKLTVLSDISIWTRKDIGEHDHALLLDALIDSSQPVHFLYGVNMPSLTTLLWRNAYEALCAAALLLCAWLMYRGRRFGSILDLKRDQRRTSSEHWLAAARYQWQHDQAAALFAAARAGVNKQAALRFPGFAQWSEAEQIATLSATSKLSSDALRAALHASPSNDSDQFCECIATLHQLRTHL